tara:strand:+ start:1099 stop:3216 length:2118 start_codon:yes stop_codon:yes gene_type:complete
MAKDLAKINLKLTAENEVLIKKLEQSQKKVGKFTKKSGSRLTKLGSKFKGLGDKVGLMGAAAGLALAALTVKTMKATDALGKTADKLGVMPEKLQAIQRAAQLTGVGVDTANMALQRMVRRVQEAAMGTGEAKGALADLGLEAKELAKLSADEQFKRIADAMGDVSESGEKVRLAMKLFDSEGVALVNTLALGSKGLEEIEDDMDALGISMTRFNISKIEQANDAFLKASQNTQSFAQSFAVALAPAIKAASDKFTEFAMDMGGFDVLALRVFGGVMKGVGVLANGFHGIKIIFQGVVAAVLIGASKLLSGVSSVTNALIKMKNTLAGTPDDVEGLTSKLQAMEASLGSMKELNFIDPEAVAGMEGEIEKVREQLRLTVEQGQDPSGLEKFVEATRLAAENAQTALQETVLSPIPSEAIEALIAQTRAKMDEIALAAAEASVAKTDPALPAEGEGDEEKAAKELTLMETLFQNKFSIKEFWKNSELEQQAMHEQQMLDMTTRHQDDMTKVTDAGEKARLKKKQLTEKTALKTKQQTEGQEKKSTGAFFKQGLGALAKNSRAAFSIQKAMDISAAVTNTYSAAMGAYKSLASIPYVGPALGAAAAAAAIGFGVKQVQAIKARKFSSGGGVSAGGAPSAASTAAPSAPTEPELVAPDLDFEESATPFRQEVTVTASDPFTPSVIRDFIEKLREEDIAVNYDVNFVGG